MSTELDTFIYEFFEGLEDARYDVLEFTIDTSISEIHRSKDGLSEIVPFLSIAVGNLHENMSFSKAMERAVREDDPGFYYDAVETGAESSFEFELSRVNPGWKEGANIDQDDLITKIDKAIQDPLKQVSIETVFFHYVDSLDVVYLRKR